MNELDLRGKLIIILKNIYIQAEFNVIIFFFFFLYSSKVLIEESLSPCLLTLFLPDAIPDFHEKGLNRLDVDHGCVIVLLFADDFILFHDSRTDAQAKLHVQRKYCGANNLK